MDKPLHLNNGRTLAYTEYGNLHGQPVFFFHYIPGSRLFCHSNEITRKAGVCLIIPDRPGSGLSDFQPGRCILDWPADVTALADSLGIDRFAVADHSGGGSYVAACAHQIPQRITAAAIPSPASARWILPMPRVA
jgi:pimeloyl-ACP methyl ester carboxylesterase